MFNVLVEHNIDVQLLEATQRKVIPSLLLGQYRLSIIHIINNWLMNSSKKILNTKVHCNLILAKGSLFHLNKRKILSF